MSMMDQVMAQELQWFAVRVKRPQSQGRRTTVLGAEYTTHRTRHGLVAKRRVVDTGRRVFVPELILQRAGFDTFLPVKKVYRAKDRYRGERQLVSLPLLADWMFVGWPAGDGRWLELMGLNVVAGVLGTGGRPVKIPVAVVMRLMQRWGGGLLSPEMHLYQKSGCEFSVGDMVRVIDGPFNGETMSVTCISGPVTKGIVNMLGGNITVELSTAILENCAE